MSIYGLEDRNLLTRYWFNIEGLFGYGVTAYSIEDALTILADEGVQPEDVKDWVENIDVRTIDYSHIVQNMGPPCFRGIWYPCLNIGWRYPRRDLLLKKDQKPEKYFVCQTGIQKRNE